MLFVGNSFTYYNNGIDKELEALSPSIRTESITEPGYSLQDHWETGDALRAIRRGGWDYVVLQEHSRTPIDVPRAFSQAFGRFDEEIRRSGATTVLLVRPDPARPETFNPELRDEYETVGSRDGVVMARIDRAFVVSLRDRPGLVLAYRGGHPRESGTYLAACVLYGTVLQSSVVGNAYAPEGLSADHRTYLQQVAAKAGGH